MLRASIPILLLCMSCATGFMIDVADYSYSGKNPSEYAESKAVSAYTVGLFQIVEYEREPVNRPTTLSCLFYHKQFSQYEKSHQTVVWFRGRVVATFDDRSNRDCGMGLGIAPPAPMVRHGIFGRFGCTKPKGFSRAEFHERLAKNVRYYSDQCASDKLKAIHFRATSIPIKNRTRPPRDRALVVLRTSDSPTPLSRTRMIDLFGPPDRAYSFSSERDKWFVWEKLGISLLETWSGSRLHINFKPEITPIGPSHHCHFTGTLMLDNKLISTDVQYKDLRQEGQSEYLNITYDNLTGGISSVALDLAP